MTYDKDATKEVITKKVPSDSQGLPSSGKSRFIPDVTQPQKNSQTDDLALAADIISSKPKRMSVSFPPDIASLLEFLADSQGVSLNEALRKAIATEAYIQQEIREGSTILVQKSNKEIREVVFR